MNESPRRVKRWHALPRRFRTVAAGSVDAVLLETAKASGEEGDRSFLFVDPVRELSATDGAGLEGLFKEVNGQLAAGRFVAGYVSYEAGEVLLGLGQRVAGDQAARPLAWFGVYERAITFDHASGKVSGDLPGGDEGATGDAPAEIRSAGLGIGLELYREKIARVQGYLAEGHSYQINFTDRITGAVEGSPLSVYELLLERQPVSFAAYLLRPEGAILSVSPELFYRTSRGVVEVRPMKGTWARGVNAGEDAEAERLLLKDEKNRSEHVTIVDLLRNDVGMICRYGSVRVEKLLTVERYNTLLQLTSSIAGELDEAVTPSMVFRKLFPSGSITGAPKLRTMEIIKELERQPRGIYTGAIGYFGPGGEACFNVAIRTLEMRDGAFVLGVGGGITADSVAEEEYAECKLKGSFMTRRQPEFALLETMRCEGKIALLERHLRRLAGSARYFGIDYDDAALRAAVKEQEALCGAVPTRVRLVLERTGTWGFTATPLEETTWHGRVLLSDCGVRSGDVFLHHKTTHREFYDGALASARRRGYDEVLFWNEKKQLTEGAISSVFLRIGGRWVTPALRCGVLAGVQREVLLETLGEVEEGEVSMEMMVRAEELLVCNSVRGVRAVRCVEAEGGVMVWGANRCG